MELSIDQSYFGRAPQEKITLKRLREIFRRAVPYILAYSNSLAKKLRKRNENQLILFPQDYHEEQSSEILQNLKQQYSQKHEYLFYLSRCQLFIDNYHIKIMRMTTPISVRFDFLGYGKVEWFADWIDKPETNYIVSVTSDNWILVISVQEKGFQKYRAEDKKTNKNAKIVSVCTYTDYLFVFTERECHLIRFKNIKNKGKGLEKIAQKNITDKCITKGQGLQKDGKFYIFSIVGQNLMLQKYELGLLSKIESKIDNKQKMLHRSEESDILNIKIFPAKINRAMTHIVIAVANNLEVILMSYNLENEVQSVLTKINNPQFSWWNFQKIFIPFITFLPRQTYLLCAIVFKYKLYFIKLWPDYCQISRRVKFQFPVEYVGEMGKQSGIVVILNNSTPQKHSKKIYLTHQNKIASFTQYVNSGMITKFHFDLELHKPFKGDCRSIAIFNRKEIFVMVGDKIERVVLSNWQEIYNQMKRTENIKLLKYLILLKHIDSPFLERPGSFFGLQSFFPSNTDQAKQILLEYYYIMDMEPVKVDISANPQLLIPFIINHKISNLSEQDKEIAMNWCLKHDKRLIQELIIGGSQCGWEIAVSQGWIRAFKVMVERGMEIQMPILKLYSMAIHQKRYSTGQNGEKIEFLTQEGLKFVNQIIEYILFVFSSFFIDLVGDGSSSQFKHFIFIIFQKEIWLFLTKFAPEQTINIISGLFISQCRIKELNKYNINDFLIFSSKFEDMALTHGYSNSEMLLSHISQTYRLNTSSQCEQYLMIQHGKLLILKYQEYLKNNRDRTTNLKQIMRIYQIFNSQVSEQYLFSKEFSKFIEKMRTRVYFNFNKEYLKSILFTLVKEENINLQKIYRQCRVYDEISGDQVEFESEMIDFLVHIWKDIFIQILKTTYQDKYKANDNFSQEERIIKIKKAIKHEIRQLLGEIEQYNYKYNYLAIHLMMAINSDNEFSLKIFNKFLSTTNDIIKEELFIWLRQALISSEPLQEEMIRKLKEVIQINKQQARDILETYYDGKEREIIKKIDNDPTLQLQYVELIIKDADQMVEKYYTDLHVELMLKLKPQQIISNLETNNELVEYDIAEALKMTLSMGDFQLKKEILIYLYQREGEINECINTYLGSIQELIFSYIALTQKHRMEEQEEKLLNATYILPSQSSYNIEKNEIINELNRKYQDSLKLIFRQPQLKYKFIESFLSKFTHFLKSIVGQSYKYRHHYTEFISEYFGSFIISIFQRGFLYHLSTWIADQSGKLDFLHDVLHYFIEGYDKLQIEQVILNRMSEMEKNILVSQIATTWKKLEYCISSQCKCHVCDRYFNEDSYVIEALLFNCGHLYHKECIDQINGIDFCYYCVSRNQYKSMIEDHNLELVELLSRYRKKKIQMRQEEKKNNGKKRQALISLEKKRLNRFNIFDKKVTAIENQAEIIDLKLMIEDYYASQIKK